MSVTELQETISRLTPAQKRSVARYIKYLVADDAPRTIARRRRITQIANEMDAGKTISLAEARRQRGRR